MVNRVKIILNWIWVNGGSIHNALVVICLILLLFSVIAYCYLVKTITP